jgi:hypothetical protein
MTSSMFVFVPQAFLVSSLESSELYWGERKKELKQQISAGRRQVSRIFVPV